MGAWLGVAIACSRPSWCPAGGTGASGAKTGTRHAPLRLPAASRPGPVEVGSGRRAQAPWMPTMKTTARVSPPPAAKPRELRIHGRGGQGAVIASKLLASALFREGKSVQAFPSFGAERTGAPVMAFLRCDHAPINEHYNVYEPDHVVVLDPMLLTSVD